MGKILRVYGYSSTVLGGGMLSLGLVANESALYVAGAGFVLTGIDLANNSYKKEPWEIPNNEPTYNRISKPVLEKKAYHKWTIDDTLRSR